MYQLLLVEDEDIIRRGLRHIIEKLNLEPMQICEAGNGIEAIEAAKESPPQIVITDIRMPFMDGLELIEALKALLPDAEFLILSGYSEFEYARKAVSLGVTEYLLKPISKEQLYAALSQIINGMKEKELEKQSLNQTLAGFAAEISHLQKSLLWNILSGKYSPEHILIKLEDSGICFPNDHFALLAFREIHGTDPDFLKESLVNVEEALKQVCSPLFRFASEYGYTYFLFNLPCHPYGKLEEFLNGYVTSAFPLLMGVSNVIHSPEHLPQLLKQSRSALDNRLFYFDTKAFSYYRFQYSGTGTAFSPQIGETILSALNRGEGEAGALIKQFFLKLLETSEVTAEWISLNIKALEYYLFSAKLVQKELKHSRLELDESVEFFLSAADTFAEFSDTIIAQLLHLEKDSASKDSRSAAVTQAMNYVQRYYAKDISLIYISNFVSMNDSYFSSLFKKTAGIGFSRYLQEVRIQNAKRLLRDPGIKIYEVAELVGFVDDKYFHKIFKKITGITPSDYRNSLCTNDFIRK